MLLRQIIFILFLFINTAVFSMFDEDELGVADNHLVSRTISLSLDEVPESHSSHIYNSDERSVEGTRDNELLIQNRLSGQQDILYFLDEDIRAYIVSHIINDGEVYESPGRKLFRKFLTTGALIAGLSAGIPYISPSCSAAKGVFPLCLAFSGGNLIAYGASTAWVGLLLVNHLKPISTIERKITEARNKHPIRRHLISNTLGALACFADVFAVYKYNSGAYKFLAIQAFIIDYLYKAEGYYKLQEQFSGCKGSIDPRALRLSQAIKKVIIPYILNNPEEALAKMTNEEAFYELLASSYTSDHSQEKSFMDPDLCMQGLPKRTFKISSLWFPISNFVINGLLAHEALRKLGAPQIFSIMAIPIFILPPFALDVFAITMSSADPVFNTLHNSIFCQRIHDSFLAKHYSNFNRILPVCAFILSGLSAAGDAYIVSDTVQGTIFGSLGILAPLSVYAATTIFEAFGTNTLLKELSENVILRYGAPLNRKIIRCISGFEKLNEILLISKPNSEVEIHEESRVLQEGTIEDFEGRVTKRLSLKKTLIRNICPLIPLVSCILVSIIIVLVNI